MPCRPASRSATIAGDRPAPPRTTCAPPKPQLEMTRNRLRILGMTDDEITKFGDTGAVSPQMTIYSPITGTVIQRKVGPGQYVNTSSQNSSASDPTFIIGDLSTVWLIAYVRESDAPSVQVGQALHFTVLAYPRPRIPGEHRLCRDLTRHGNAATTGARYDRQFAASVASRNVCECHHPHRRRRQFAGHSARCSHLRR